MYVVYFKIVSQAREKNWSRKTFTCDFDVSLFNSNTSTVVVKCASKRTGREEEGREREGEKERGRIHLRREENLRQFSSLNLNLVKVSLF